jgi:death-on-curing protein
MPVCFAVSLNRRTHDGDFLGTRTVLPDARTDRYNSLGSDSSVGGLHGLRSEDALESAIAQPQNVYFYGGGDLYEIAAAYAFHIAESQAFLDGNKRTPVQAAVDFLEVNGIDTGPLPEPATYEAMIRVATHKFDRSGLAVFLREVLKPKI